MTVLKDLVKAIANLDGTIRSRHGRNCVCDICLAAMAVRKGCMLAAEEWSGASAEVVLFAHPLRDKNE